MTALLTTPRPTTRTRALLTAAAAAGPTFFAVAGLQMLARDGFDLRVHPISQLATGGPGWIQIANFALMGLGVLGLAVAHRRLVTTGVGRRALPLLLGAFGIGLVLSGVLVMDAQNGFPVGAPDGPLPTMSWHAVGHVAAAALAFTALSLACLVHAVRSLRARRTLPALGSLAVAVVLNLPMSPDGYTVQLAVVAAVGFGWASVLALALRGRVAV